MISFLIVLPQQLIPERSVWGTSTPSRTDVWEGSDFLEMDMHCSHFVLLSKNLSCVEMQCSLFAQACCYSSLQTVQPFPDLL